MESAKCVELVIHRHKSYKREEILETTVLKHVTDNEGREEFVVLVESVGNTHLWSVYVSGQVIMTSIAVSHTIFPVSLIDHILST